MQKRLLAPAAAAALLFCANFELPAPPVAAAAGPGGVIAAIEEMLAAMDRGDRAAVAALLVASPHDYTVAYGKDGKPQQHPKDGAEASVDVQMVRDPLLDLLTKTKDAAKGTIRHRIRAIRANCPAEDCSYGLVEFDRIRSEGDAEQVTPMSATVLTRYDRKLQRMRVFLWHAAETRGV